MSEAERIKREQMLQEAIKKRLQFGQGDLPHGAYSYDPNQPVPMAGYPTPEGHKSPSLYYQSLLAQGMPQERARMQTIEATQQGNEIAKTNPAYASWPVEGEY